MYAKLCLISWKKEQHITFKKNEKFASLFLISIVKVFNLIVFFKIDT